MSLFHVENIKSVTEFRAKIRERLSQLKTSGRADVITLNGEPEGVVMAPDTFQRLVDDAEYGRSVRRTRESLAQFDAGKDVRAADVFSQMREQLDRADG